MKNGIYFTTKREKYMFLWMLTCIGVLIGALMFSISGTNENTQKLKQDFGKKPEKKVAESPRLEIITLIDSFALPTLEAGYSPKKLFVISDGTSINFGNSSADEWSKRVL